MQIPLEIEMQHYYSKYQFLIQGNFYRKKRYNV